MGEGHHGWRPTALAAVTVGWGVRYNTAGLTGRVSSCANGPAHSVTLEHSPTRTGGAGHGPRGPWPWRLPAQMSPGLLSGHFQAPAQPQPRQQLDGPAPPIGAQQGLGRALRVRIADEDPADRQGGHAGVRPDRRSRGGLHHPLPCALPAASRPRGAVWGRLPQHWGQRRLPLAREARPAMRPWLVGWGRCRAGGSPPHTGDATAGRRPPTQPPPPGYDGATGLGDEHQVTRGPPAPYPQAPLSGPGGQLLVLLATVPRVALGRGQPRHAGQGPEARAPRHGAQAQQAPPAPPAAVDHLTVGGAHRIASHPLGPDRRAPAALPGIVRTPAPWTGGGPGVRRRSKGQTRSLHTRPDGTVQDALLWLKGLRRRQTPHPPGRRDGPLAGGQNGPDHPHVSVGPPPLRQEGSAGDEHDRTCLGPRTPRRPPSVAEVLERTASFVGCPQWIKSSLVLC
jgi:hypothetical protein